MDNIWILVEWLETDHLFPSYNIVSGNRVVEIGNVVVGKVIHLRKKHSDVIKQAQVLKVSGNKNSLKEVKSMLTRLNQQMRHTVDTCMSTIGALKTEIMEIYDKEYPAVNEIKNAKLNGKNDGRKKDKVVQETTTIDRGTQTDNQYFTDNIKQLQDSLEDGYRKLTRAMSVLTNNSQRITKRNGAKVVTVMAKRTKKNIDDNNVLNCKPSRKICQDTNEANGFLEETTTSYCQRSRNMVSIEDTSNGTFCTATKDITYIDESRESSDITEELINCLRERRRVANLQKLNSTSSEEMVHHRPYKESEKIRNSVTAATLSTCCNEPETAKSGVTIRNSKCKKTAKQNQSRETVKSQDSDNVTGSQCQSSESTHRNPTVKTDGKRNVKHVSYHESDDEESEESNTVSKYSRNFSPPLMRHYVNTRKVLAPINDSLRLKDDNNINIIADAASPKKLEGKDQDMAYANVGEENLEAETTKQKEDGYRQVRVLRNNNSIKYSDSNEASSPNTRNQIADDLVPIGKGNALVPKQVLDSLDWKSYTTATRKLLQAIFTREVLSTHSLSGKRSPAFSNKPAKKQLDPKVIDDIIMTVSKECNTKECFVRTCITVKCADEAKMWKQRMSRQRAENDENSPSDNVINLNSTL